MYKDDKGLIGMYSYNFPSHPDGGGYTYYDVHGNKIASDADFSLLNLTADSELTEKQRREKAQKKKIYSYLTSEFPNTVTHTCP